MEQFLQLLVGALAIGSIYAVIALSFELAYEATGVVNFATGQLVVVGALVGASSLAYARAGIGFSYLGTFVVMAVVGLALFVVGVTAALIVGLFLLMHHSFVGRQFRALAQDPEAARLMGIRVVWLHGFTWVLVASLAGIAGVLLSPMWFIDVNMGDSLALKAFAAAVIGGFGSIPGAICGGLLVGAAEIFGASYISSAYKDALVFALMIGFLLARPQGLFGERIGERG